MTNSEGINQAIDYILYSNEECVSKYKYDIISKCEDLIKEIQENKSTKAIKKYILFCMENNINIAYPKYYNNYKLIEDNNTLNKNLYFLKDIEYLKEDINLDKSLLDLENIKKNGSLGLESISRKKGPMFRKNALKIFKAIKNDDYESIYEFIGFENETLKEELLSCRGKSKMLSHFNLITDLDYEKMDYSKNFILLGTDKENQNFFNSTSDYDNLEKGLDIIIHIGNRNELGLENGGCITIGGEAKEINQGGGTQGHQFKDMLKIGKLNGNSTKGIGLYSGSAIYKHNAFGLKIQEGVKNLNIIHVGSLFLDFDDTINKIIKRK